MNNGSFIPIKQRLDRRVTQGPGCRVWTGYKAPLGYGQIREDKDGRLLYAHRVAYEIYVGAIPEGLELDHLCRNPSCANPEHLEPVSHRENLLRGVGIAAIYAARTHCQKGHEFSIENICNYKSDKGKRICKICKRERERNRGRL